LVELQLLSFHPFNLIGENTFFFIVSPSVWWSMSILSALLVRWYWWDNSLVGSNWVFFKWHVWIEGFIVKIIYEIRLCCSVACIFSSLWFWNQ
jgi:hypothetical protein